MLAGIRWHVAANVICAGPAERLIVMQHPVGSFDDVTEALLSATIMEWRDRGGRRWTIERCGEAVRFLSHYRSLGPVSLSSARSLAEISDAELEQLLSTAKAFTD